MSLPLEKIRKILWQMDEHRVRSDFMQHSKVQNWPCGSEILDKPREDKSRLHQFGKKDVGWHFQRQRLAHGRWTDKRLAHRKLWRTSHQRCTWKGSNHRHVCETVHIPMCRRVDQTRGTRRTSSATPFDHVSQRRPQLPNNAGGDFVADKYFLPAMSAARCHLPSHVAPRGQLCVPSEPSFPTPLKHNGAIRLAKTNLENLEEGIIDYGWNVDGNKIFSEHWKGFTGLLKGTKWVVGT